MKKITISAKSQEIIQQLQKNSTEPFQGLESNTEMTLAQLNAWMRVQDCPRNQRFQYETLCAELLSDIHKAYACQHVSTKKNDTQATPWYKKALFGLLLVSGVLVAVCEGYDAIASILGMFSAIPAIAIFITGLAFSLLSVAVFVGFDLVETAKNLDVPLTQTRALLDVYLEQAAMIKTIRKTLRDNLQDYHHDDLLALQELSATLKKQHEKLAEIGRQYETSLNNPFLRSLKLMTAGATGILYFGGGFFAGQAMATAVAGLFLASVSPTFWPVIAVGVVIGLAAFCGYWYVERPGVENLIGRFLGLDYEKIEKLKQEKMVVQATKLAKLETEIIRACRQHNPQSQACIEPLAPRVGKQRDIQRLADNEPLTQPDHSFFKSTKLLPRSKSMNDCNSQLQPNFSPTLSVNMTQ